MKLTPLRKQILLVGGLLALGEVMLAIPFLARGPLRTQYTLAPASATSKLSLRDLSPSLVSDSSACKDNPLFNTISGIDTTGQMIQTFGPPEKVFSWHQGGAENLFVNYGYKYLYPHKGFNFIAYGTPRIYGNAEAIDPHFVPPTVMPMNNPQAAIFHECYPPTTLEAYEAKYPGYGEGSSSEYGDQYVDWISP